MNIMRTDRGRRCGIGENAHASRTRVTLLEG
ncbi:hypothetical protein FHY05_004077 [Sphingomonas sp. BK580]|nr:hypothetical protein [Sphingomonas sp. BK069]MBB3695417.1 hypothetical protein [Sphingomonas sp. BK580]